MSNRLSRTKPGKLLFGGDPEFASIYMKGGEPNTLPPYFFRKFLGVPASDDERHPVFIQGDVFKLHEDGASWEISIRPSHNYMDLFDETRLAVAAGEEQILRHFPEHCLPNFQFLPTVNYDVERWEAMADELGEEFRAEFQMSTRFGCDPDRDALDSEAKCFVEDASLHPYRYCGGHVHISGSKYVARYPLLAVKSLVVTAGLAATANSDVPDLERLRTYSYGKPAKFRIQSYPGTSFGKDYELGIEYRTTSCRMYGNREIFSTVLQWVEIGILEVLEKGLHEVLLPKYLEDAAKAIIEQNQEDARQILAQISTHL